MKTQLIAQTLDFTKEAVNQKLPGYQNATNPEKGFGTLLSGIFSMVMVIAAILVLVSLIWGAVEWIASGGDKSKVEKARNRITQSIVGLIVLAATTAIFMVVQSFLGICVVSFGGSCSSGGSTTQVTATPTPRR